MRIWGILIALILASAPALAQFQRLLPKDAKLGVLVGQHRFPLVQIDGKILRMAPGGVIVDQQNRTIVHGALPAKAPVLFKQDAAGELTQVILLRPEERSVIDRAGKR